MDNPPANDREEGNSYLGEMAKSSFSGSGSDQTKSAIGPSCGISMGATPRGYYETEQRRSHKSEKGGATGWKVKDGKMKDIF